MKISQTQGTFWIPKCLCQSKQKEYLANLRHATEWSRDIYILEIPRFSIIVCIHYVRLCPALRVCLVLCAIKSVQYKSVLWRWQIIKHWNTAEKTKKERQAKAFLTHLLCAPPVRMIENEERANEEPGKCTHPHRLNVSEWNKKLLSDEKLREFGTTNRGKWSWSQTVPTNKRTKTTNKQKWQLAR